MTTIPVWLKIKDRGNMDSVLYHLNFWLNLFKDQDKYKIYIYNEDCVLPERYGIHTIVNKAKLLENHHCRELNEKIKNNFITPNWKGAAFALSAPYYYLESEYVWNIDADDIVIEGDALRYLEQAYNIMKDNGYPTLSYDMYLSCHGAAHLHHWSFGVNISRRLAMRHYIDVTMSTPLRPAPWGINIDYMLDRYLTDKTSYRYLSFITPTNLLHGGQTGYWSGWSDTHQAVVVNLYGKPVPAPLHPRSILIR